MGGPQCSEKGSGGGHRGKEDEKRDHLRRAPVPSFFAKGADPQTADENKSLSSTMGLYNTKVFAAAKLHELVKL